MSKDGSHADRVNRRVPRRLFRLRSAFASSLLKNSNSVGNLSAGSLYVSKCGSVEMECCFLTPMFNLKKK